MYKTGRFKRLQQLQIIVLYHGFGCINSRNVHV